METELVLQTSVQLLILVRPSAGEHYIGLFLLYCGFVFLFPHVNFCDKHTYIELTKPNKNKTINYKYYSNVLHTFTRTI